MGDCLGIPGAVDFYFGLNCWYEEFKSIKITVIIVYGHTTLNTPVLVRSPKLSNVGPGQYLDGRLPGNTGCRRLLFWINCRYEEFKSIKITVIIVYGHTTLNTPVLVRSPKLSNVGPGQYLDGRLPGNTGCRRLLFWLKCWYEEFKHIKTTVIIVYGHTTLNTPVLVRSPKLSNVGPGQYLDGRLPGNTGCRNLLFWINCRYEEFKSIKITVIIVYGHTTLNTPVLVRSPKLSNVGPGQYLDGRLPGNTGCRRLLFWLKCWYEEFKHIQTTVIIVYGHTTLNTPVLVRSPKLSNVWPGQYLDGRLPGNTGCRKLLFWINCRYEEFKSIKITVIIVYGHTTLNTPVLVRSPKLSNVGPGQYLDGRLPGNTGCRRLLFWINCRYEEFKSIKITVIIVYGHTTLNTPVLVRSPKLSNVGPGQYLDGRLPGNTGCRRLLFWLKCWYEEFKHIQTTVIIVYGHTTLNTPVLVRSPKLSNVWPGQYLDGRLPGNTGCRKRLFWINCRYEEFKSINITVIIVYGHTTLNTPVLVRSPKLSNVGPGQYLDGRLPGNTGCRRLLFWLKCWYEEFKHIKTTMIIVYGHTTLNTPVLVRSPKLSNVGPGQYLDGRLPGNTGCRRLLFWINCRYEEFKSIKITVIIVYGHTTLNTPVLVRSPKLSNVGPGQYLDGRLPGNTGCRRLLFWLKCWYEEFKHIKTTMIIVYGHTTLNTPVLVR